MIYLHSPMYVQYFVLTESKIYTNTDTHWGSGMSNIMNGKDSAVNVGFELVPVKLVVTN